MSLPLVPDFTKVGPQVKLRKVKNIFTRNSLRNIIAVLDQEAPRSLKMSDRQLIKMNLEFEGIVMGDPCRKRDLYIKETGAFSFYVCSKEFRTIVLSTLAQYRGVSSSQMKKVFAVMGIGITTRQVASIRNWWFTRKNNAINNNSFKQRRQLHGDRR
jgi:AraC-like DNA-binding protein